MTARHILFALTAALLAPLVLAALVLAGVVLADLAGQLVP